MEDKSLDSYWQQCRGVIGRYPKENERYVFDYEATALRAVHMVGVRKPLRVTWWVDEEKNVSEILRPWLGIGIHRADKITEERP